MTKAIEVVIFLFAAFGHFLTNIAPPDENNTSLAIGLASFVSLGILLWISALSTKRKSKKTKRRWLISSAIAIVLAVISTVVYIQIYDRYTFIFPPQNPQERFMNGLEMSKEASDYAVQNKLSKSQLVYHYGIENIDEIWSTQGINQAKFRLMIVYLLMVIGFSTGFFCLTEGILKKFET